jgi:hypothetical protein
MRKTILAIVTICGLVCALPGCSNLLDNPQSGGTTGTVLVQVGASGTEARTVGPSAADFAEYKLIFEKGPVVIPELMTPAENGRAFDLEPGTWTLKVTGFIDLGGEKVPAVSGSSSVIVAAGKTVQAKVILDESETDTYGTFDYSAIDFSGIETGTLKNAEMTIIPSDPNKGTVTIDLMNGNNSRTLELPAGIYTALVELTSGRSIVIDEFEHELNAYREEIVYIYPYMTTALRAGEYEFTETDFIADLYFTGTAVIDPFSTGTDTYKPTMVHILRAVDKEGYKIDDNLGFDYRLIAEAPIDDNGNWELYLPSNLIADDIEAPFTSTDSEYENLGGYPVFFVFTMQSQQNSANTVQSRWVWQEIVNKHGRRDIELEAKIRKITVPVWGIVEGSSAVKTSVGYDVVYADDSDNKIKLTVTGNLISTSVEVRKGDENILLTPEDDEFVVASDEDSAFISFKMPDDDVRVISAKFFIPEGNVIVRDANELSGGYTAQQVFVWLADEDTDIAPLVFAASGNPWSFTLPSEHQAYSGDFLFQFRLTRNNKPDILSKKFRVNVSQLAIDAENTISLVVDIRTLTVTDTAGKGTVTITASEMRDEDGNLTPPPPISSGDYAAEGTDIRVQVTPIDGDYVSGLDYIQTSLPSNNYPAVLIPSSGGSRTYGFIMPLYNTTVTAKFVASLAVGDTGPAGGLIFYVEGNSDKVTTQGWKYLEAAPVDALSLYEEKESNSIDWMTLPYSKPEDEQEYYYVATASNIGEGRQNTLNMIQAVKDGAGETGYSNYENGAAKACDIFTYGGYDDWFLPSKDELYEMYTELAYHQSLGGFEDALYWSSTASNSEEENAWAIDFSSGSAEAKEKHHEYLRVRPVRAF